MPSHGIFRLQNAAELQEAEELYLPKGAENTCAIVLAASRGDELGELTEHQPKTMVKIQGTPILSHIVDAYNAIGIKDIVVVRGYKKEAVNLPNLNYVDNNDFADTGKLDSLLKALRSRKGHVQSTIISYGDVLFNKYIPSPSVRRTMTMSFSSTATGMNRPATPASVALPSAPFPIREMRSMQDLSQAVGGVWMGFL